MHQRLLATTINTRRLPTFAARTLIVNVIFGQPTVTGDCVHSGICDLTGGDYAPAAGEARQTCRHARALLQLSPQGRLQAFFPRAGMLPCTAQAFFAGSCFGMPLAHCLSADLAAQLDHAGPLFIAADNHPIQRTIEGYWVTFR